jgi:ribosomal protein S6--L-glutamate ligase
VLRVAILSTDYAYYSTARLLDAFQKAGAAVVCVDPARTTLTSPVVLPGLPPGPTPADIVLPRLGSRHFDTSLAFLEHLVRQGARSFPGPDALRSCRRKSSVLLDPPPEVSAVPSALVRDPAVAEPIAKNLGGFPVVAKPDMGTQGMGAAVLHEALSLRAYVAAAASLGHDTLVQPYFKGARDIRVMVVGGLPLAAMSRRPAQGDFRANVHRGALPSPLDPNGPWAAPARAAAARLHLTVAGVDFLTHQGRLWLMEVNASPGLRGIEAATGLDLAGEIASLCLASKS